MKIDVYDTYATALDGTILHFDSLVPAGMRQNEVEQLIHDFVGADDPEIEIALDRWKSSGQTPIAPGTLAKVERCGFAVVPLRRIGRTAG
ncbi:DUF2024 family protein [Rhodopirellula sallentina]|uniref:Uncharacterized protein n=1 Tax=Rhodopirellula sallentina SM41 TaxID=1263870 RepID=M5UFT1_9BACT|nr:DUF2024 family protein [Rhodopirellula sallentina]EMI54863.1 hypothetical protein RSSM_03686 [Rhodopirellula sallentina SM41]